MGGSDDMANLVGDVSKEVGQEGFKHAGYGEEKKKPQLKEAYSTMPKKHSPLEHDSSAYDFARKEMANKGQGLYAGRQRGGAIKGFEIRMPSANTNYANSKGLKQGSGIEPPSRLVGGGVYKSFESLHNANMGYSNAVDKLSQMQDRRVHAQHEQEPIKRYWDGEGQPPSRGTGFNNHSHAKSHHSRSAGYESHNHYNLMRGKGTILNHRSELPPALQSQPYGANFHMQFMLPPQYHKYNDGTDEY